MSYVAINVLSVPPERGRTLEQRFAAHAGSVHRAPGFEHFELLRPAEGTESYLVYTRWRDKADYQAWLTSRSFEESHTRARAEGAASADASHPHASHPHASHPEAGPAHAGEGAAADGPAATASTLWAFDVVQSVDPQG